MCFDFRIRGWAGALGLLGLAGCVHYQPAPISPANQVVALENRSLADPGLQAFLAQNLTPAPGQWPLTNWAFEPLSLAAFYFHPSLEVARAQWGVARAGVKTAGGRPNPVVSAVPGYTGNPGSGVSPWIPVFSVDVPIETAGKRGYRLAAADHLAEAARLGIQTTAWQVRSGLRNAWLDYQAAVLRAVLLRRQLELQQQTLTLLEQRLKAGVVARPELTPTRLLQAKTSVDYAAAVRAAAEARVRVAEAVGLPVKAFENVSFDTSSRSILGLHPEQSQNLTDRQARLHALLGRADLRAGLAEYQASESVLQLEIAKQYPDVHLNPGYQFDQGEHKWSLGLSLELPVLNRNQGPIAEALAKRAEAGARFLALQAKVLAEIDRALALRAAAFEQVARQSELTRLAQDLATSSQALFRAGAGDRLELVNAQLEASAGELATLDARIKAQQAVDQLEDALQYPLEKWPALETDPTAQAKTNAP